MVNLMFINNKENKTLSCEDLKKIEYGMLLEFHNFCTKNGLTYFLTGGTLLGAIRHKGFIPWDDDIDVTMPRHDYDIFIEMYFKDRNRKYLIKDVKLDKNYYYPYAKMVDPDTIVYENLNTRTSIGVFMDIFPLDNVGSTYRDAVRIFNKVKRLRNIHSVKIISVSGSRKWYKNLVILLGHLFLSLLSLNGLSKRIETMSKKYQSSGMTRYVSPCVIGTYGVSHEIFESEWYSGALLMEFEKNKFNVPCGYDEILKTLYGDYMKLPPVEKRVTHHEFKAYKRK